MSRLILATGIDELDKTLTESLSSAYTVESVTFLQALTVVRVKRGDVVMLSDDIPMGGTGIQGLIDVVDHLRRHDVRVIYLGTARGLEDKLIPELVSRGVYDLLLSDELVIEDLFERLATPATYAEVAYWMRGSSRSGPTTSEPVRRSMTWRNQSDESEEVNLAKQDEVKPSGGNRSPLRRLNWGKSQGSVTKAGPRIVIVTGLPGSGVSFVALHLALSYVKAERVTLIEASERPVYTAWLNGPVGDRGAHQLAMRKVPERAWTPSANLRILPSHPDECGPSLSSLRPVLNELDADVVVLDVALDEVRNLGEPVDVLVIPPDITKAGHVRDIQTRMVVVNMAPSHLPVELEEYGITWANATITMCPYVPEQALAVVTGHVVGEVEVWCVGDKWIKIGGRRGC